MHLVVGCNVRPQLISYCWLYLDFDQGWHLTHLFFCANAQFNLDRCYAAKPLVPFSEVSKTSKLWDTWSHKHYGSINPTLSKLIQRDFLSLGFLHQLKSQQTIIHKPQTSTWSTSWETADLGKPWPWTRQDHLSTAVTQARRSVRAHQKPVVGSTGW